MGCAVGTGALVGVSVGTELYGAVAVVVVGLVLAVSGLVLAGKTGLAGILVVDGIVVAVAVA